MATKTKKRIFYLDALRFVAITMVILIHVIGPFIGNLNATTIYSPRGITSITIYNFSRCGVDLFLVLSGALSLGREWTIKEFLGKRIPRIVKPYIFWSIVTTTVLIVLSYYFSIFNFVESFGAYDILSYYYKTIILHNTSLAGVYWFFWMILGTYLIMPIYNKWIYNSNLKELEYFLVLWVISTIFDYTLMMSCPVKLSYFISPIGLVILGYYLRYTDRKIFNNKYFAILMIILPVLIKIVYTYMIYDSGNIIKFDRYSILVIIEVVGIYCLFKTSNYLKDPGNIVKAFVTSVAACSYGMYLCHNQIRGIVYEISKLGSFNFPIMFLISLCGAFFLSWAIVYLLGKIPYLCDYAGVK